ITLGTTQRANALQQWSPAAESHPVTGPRVHGANQTPGTCSQGTLSVVDTWGFFTHKDKEAESQCEGLPLHLLLVHLQLGGHCRKLDNYNIITIQQQRNSHLGKALRQQYLLLTLGDTEDVVGLKMSCNFLGRDQIDVMQRTAACLWGQFQ
ncbi:hypothetical protein JOQ06_008056, partial [Pogonophryne albipinna]